MSSQPLALAIRLATKQETENDPPLARLTITEDAGRSSGKGIESGRGNFQFWLKDIKIAESLYAINRSAKHLVEFSDQFVGHYDTSSNNRPVSIMSDGDVMFMTQLTDDISRGVREISTARYHGMRAKKRKVRYQEVERQAPDEQSSRSKRVQVSREGPSCQKCGCSNTPEWRMGPDGFKSLCNVCGLLYAKQKKKRAMSTAAFPSNISSLGIRE